MFDLTDILREIFLRFGKNVHFIRLFGLAEFSIGLFLLIGTAIGEFSCACDTNLRMLGRYFASVLFTLIGLLCFIFAKRLSAHLSRRRDGLTTYDTPRDGSPPCPASR